jgi:hypothetical protein
LKTARRSTAHLAAQAEDHEQKAKLLELRVREQEGRTVDVEYHNNLVDGAVGEGIMELHNPRSSVAAIWRCVGEPR